MYSQQRRTWLWTGRTIKVDVDYTRPSFSPRAAVPDGMSRDECAAQIALIQHAKHALQHVADASFYTPSPHDERDLRLVLGQYAPASIADVAPFDAHRLIHGRKANPDVDALRCKLAKRLQQRTEEVETCVLLGFGAKTYGALTAAETRQLHDRVMNDPWGVDSVQSLGASSMSVWKAHERELCRVEANWYSGRTNGMTDSDRYERRLRRHQIRQEVHAHDTLGDDDSDEAEGEDEVEGDVDVEEEGFGSPKRSVCLGDYLPELPVQDQYNMCEDMTPETTSRQSVEVERPASCVLA